MASLPRLGYQIRPLLAPLTLRGKPLPTEAKIGLAIGAGALIAPGVYTLFGKKR